MVLYRATDYIIYIYIYIYIIHYILYNNIHIFIDTCTNIYIYIYIYGPSAGALEAESPKNTNNIKNEQVFRSRNMRFSYGCAPCEAVYISYGSRMLPGPPGL